MWRLCAATDNQGLIIDARSVAGVLHARGLRLPEEEQREILRLILSCFAARGGSQLLDYRDFAAFLRPPLFVLHVFTPFTKLELRVAPGETVSDIRLRIQRRLFWQQHSASGAAGYADCRRLSVARFVFLPVHHSHRIFNLSELWELRYYLYQILPDFVVFLIF